MHVRANPSEVFVSYSFERRGMSCERSDGFVTPREYGIGIFEGGGEIEAALEGIEMGV